MMAVATLDDTCTTDNILVVMKRMCRKRNRDIIITLFLIIILFIIWLNIEVNRTLGNKWNFVDCQFPCYGVTCKVCKPWTRKDVPAVDIISHLKLKHVQRPAIPQNLTASNAFFNNRDQICKHASFELIHDSLKYAFFPLNKLNCTGTKLFYLDYPVFRMNSSVLKGRKLQKCLYFGIERMTDDFFVYTEPVVKETEPFDLVFKQDFIHVKCYLNESKKDPPAKLENDTDKMKIPNRGDAHKGNTGLHDVQGLIELGKEVNNSNNKIKEPKPLEKLEDGIADRKSIIRQLLEIQDYMDNNGGEEVEVQDNNYDQNDENWYHDYMPYDPYDTYPTEVPADFEQLLVQVYPRSEVFERIERKLINRQTDQTYMNVLMIGFDSMSHLAFQRKLPITYKYLKHTLKSVILDGYNIVGDATTAALIPMLTGKFDTELPEVRKSELESEYVDVYPLIWKKFHEAGYATLYAEDEPSIGVFNMRFNGFKDQPTDHYMRPFFQAMWETELRRSSPRYCSGFKPNHEFLLDYVRDFFIKYDNVSKFAFVFGSELTHWDNNPGEYMDNDLTNLLRFFKEKKFLDNTLLIVMGDHGARYSRVRNTVQGKMEERLPMMSLRFPEWFQDKYPILHKNLQTNSDKLATPFDIHETLKNVLDIKRAKNPMNHSSRAVSLLQSIPLNRTCASAHIQMHWCTCLKQVDLEPTDKHVLKSARTILKFINRQTSQVRNQCVKLTIKEILHAQLLIPNEKVLMFQKSQDDDQRIANFSYDINVDHAHFQVTIETLPNKGLYEATVQVNMTEGSYTVIDDASRLNLYGNQPLCIQDKYPDMRKYCFCKNFNVTQKSKPEREINEKGAEMKNWELERGEREIGTTNAKLKEEKMALRHARQNKDFAKDTESKQNVRNMQKGGLIVKKSKEFKPFPNDSF